LSGWQGTLTLRHRSAATPGGCLAGQVTADLLLRPTVARQVMRDDITRMLVNRARFDNSEETHEQIRERTPAVRQIEHTIEYLDWLRRL
jgi:hypothetical protein